MVIPDTIAVMAAVLYAHSPPAGRSEEIIVRQTIRLWDELERQLVDRSCGNAMVTHSEKPGSTG